MPDVRLQCRCATRKDKRVFAVPAGRTPLDAVAELTPRHARRPAFAAMRARRAARDARAHRGDDRRGEAAPVPRVGPPAAASRFSRADRAWRTVDRYADAGARARAHRAREGRWRRAFGRRRWRPRRLGLPRVLPRHGPRVILQDVPRRTRFRRERLGRYLRRAFALGVARGPHPGEASARPCSTMSSARASGPSTSRRARSSPRRLVRRSWRRTCLESWTSTSCTARRTPRCWCTAGAGASGVCRWRTPCHA